MMPKRAENFVSVQIEVDKIGKVPPLPSSKNTDRHLIGITFLKNKENPPVRVTGVPDEIQTWNL
jgi:hypothetical protein